MIGNIKYVSDTNVKQTSAAVAAVVSGLEKLQSTGKQMVTMVTTKNLHNFALLGAAFQT